MRFTNKVLLADHAAKRRIWLVRLQRGARFPAHGHAGDEECMVPEGDVELGSSWMTAGDFHFTRRGVEHPEAASHVGCLLCVTGAL